MIRITSLNRKIKKIKWGLKDLGKEVQPHPFKVYKRFKENKAARTLSEAEAQKITAELQKIHQDNEYARRMTMHESEALARLVAAASPAPARARLAGITPARSASVNKTGFRRRS